MLALVLISLFPASGLLPTAAEGGSRSRAEGVEWVVIGRPVGPAVRGSKAQLEVEVTTRAGFHLNDDYPLNFRSKASSSAAFARPGSTEMTASSSSDAEPIRHTRALLAFPSPSRRRCLVQLKWGELSRSLHATPI